MISITSDELLTYICDNDILDFEKIRKDAEFDNMKKQISEIHNHKIWQGKDEKWYTYVTCENKRKLIKKTKKETLIKYLYDYYYSPNVLGVRLFHDVFNEWIDNKLYYREIQKQTYDRYVSDYEKYVKGTIIDSTEFNKISEDMLEDFIRETIRSEELTAKHWAKLRLVLRGTFKWGLKNKYTDLNIQIFLSSIELSPNIFKKRVFTDEESVFTKNEVSRIFSYINENPPSVINLAIKLAFQTGLRAGEISSIKWSDIKNGYIEVNKTEIRYKDEEGYYVYEIRDNAKTLAGNRKVIILDDAKETLAEIKKLSKSDFVISDGSRRIHSKAFTKKLERICGYLNIIPKSIHKARKTYATNLMSSGVDKKLILRQMGHTDLTTTDTFYYFNNRTLEESRQELEKVITGY